MTIHTCNSILVDQRENNKASFKNSGELKFVLENQTEEQLFIYPDGMPCYQFQLDSASFGEAMYNFFRYLSGPTYQTMCGKLNKLPQEDETFERFTDFLSKCKPDIDFINSEFEKIFKPEQQSPS